MAANNEAENCAKSLACIRKNSLFAKSENGGESAAILMTLVTTAMANGGVPGSLHREVLKNIGTDGKDLSKYMPCPHGCVKGSSTGSKPKNPYEDPYEFTDIRKSPVIQRIRAFSSKFAANYIIRAHRQAIGSTVFKQRYLLSFCFAEGIHVFLLSLLTCHVKGIPYNPYNRYIPYYYGRSSAVRGLFDDYF